MASDLPMTWPAAGRRWCCSTPASSTGGCGTTLSRCSPTWPPSSGTTRGFGESSRPPNGEFARWNDLFAVMDAAGADEAHLVGVSQGAETALDATLMMPNRVGRLLPVRRRDARLAVARRAQRALEAGGRGLGGAAIWTAVPKSPWSRGSTARSVWRSSRPRCPSSRMGDATPGHRSGERRCHCSARASSSERLGEIRAPTLVTVGELDQPDMVDIAERLATASPTPRTWCTLAWRICRRWSGRPSLRSCSTSS